MFVYENVYLHLSNSKKVYNTYIARQIVIKYVNM